MSGNSEMEEQLKVCRAVMHDIAFIVDLSQRVQEKLTASGSLQHIGPIPVTTVEAQVHAGTAHILDKSSERLGSVFVEPVTDVHMPHLVRWKLDDIPLALWFLQKLMIEPEKQGNGLGYTFLDGIKAYVASHNTPAMIILDCWAGNNKLRTFYIRAGFSLHGVFPEKDYMLAVFTLVTG